MLLMAQKCLYTCVFTVSAKCPNMCTCSVTLVKHKYKFIKETKIDKLAYSLKKHIDFFYFSVRLLQAMGFGISEGERNKIRCPRRCEIFAR